MKSRPAVPRRTFSPPFRAARSVGFGVARATFSSFAALSVGFSFGGFFFLWMRTSAYSSSSPSAAAALRLRHLGEVVAEAGESVCAISGVATSDITAR